MKDFRQAVGIQLLPKQSLITGISEELPEENSQKCALIESTQLAKEVLDKLDHEVNAQDIRFSRIGIFTDVENSLINSGDSLEAKIYFGAYSENTEKAFDILADGEKIEIKNGVGILKRKVDNKGRNEVKISVRSRKDSKHWKDFEREETLHYVVK